MGVPPEEATRSPWEPVVEKGRNTFPTLVPAEELVWHTNGCLKTEGEMRRPWGGRACFLGHGKVTEMTAGQARDHVDRLGPQSGIT